MKNNSDKLKSVRFITDPIHETIYFEEDDPNEQKIWDIINSKWFQRLRRIKQLGIASLVYPSANHDRFSHSLGVFHLARRWCRYILKYKDVNEILKDKMPIFQVAALLHDLGHGPASHLFENIIWGIASDETKIKLKKANKGRKDYFSHEDYTIKIIDSKDISEIIENICSVNEVKKIIKPDKSSECDDEGYYDNLCFMLSSQIDVDRLDYLVRDAHFAGVKYGKVDLDRIMWCSDLEVKKDECKYRIGFKRKSLDALQHYLIGRYFMHRTVYFHKTIKAAEFLIKEIFKEAKNIQDSLIVREKGGKLPLDKAERASDTSLDMMLNYDEYFNYSKKKESNGVQIDLEKHYIHMDDDWMLGWINEWYINKNKLGRLGKLCDHFMNRKLWKMKIFMCDDIGLKNLEEEGNKIEKEFNKKEFHHEELESASYYEPYDEKKNPIQLIDKHRRWSKISVDDYLGVAFKKIDHPMYALYYERDDALEDRINERTKLVEGLVKPF